MPGHRLPVLVYQDGSGLYNALPVEPVTQLVGTGSSAVAAVKQVKTYLKWAFDKQPWLDEPDFQKPQLKKITVPIRPRYRTHEREFPLDELFPLTVHCLIGKRADGLNTCAAPLVNVRFDYDNPKSFDDLIREAVQSNFAETTPRGLSRFLPPQNVTLEEIAITVRPRDRWTEPDAFIPTLDEIADPIGKRNILARFSRAWERDGRVQLLTQLLMDRTSSVLLVGPPGVGKTTILVEAVREAERKLHADRKTESDDTPEQQTRYRFWRTNASRIIAGMQYLGEWEARCEEIVAELSEIQGVLCLEELAGLLRVGGREANASIAAFFMPYLQQRELRLVAETTPESLDACDRLLPGFSDLFTKVNVEPLGRDATLRVLGKVLEGPGQKNSFTIEDGAADQACRLFQRFYPYRVFPGPVAQFLKDLADKAVEESREVIDAETVRSEFARLTGLPALFLQDHEPLEANDVRKWLDDRVIGQPDACAAVTHVVTTFKAGLNDPQRPLSVSLFCGPTGVGKTELSKALARFCFPGGEESEHFFRLDMSEFLGIGSADRLITSPDGSPGPLVKHVREHPFSVVLLDEVEKADPEVFDVLLGLFEEGRLTDPVGRVTWFQSVVIIMTSNIGATSGQTVGFRPDSVPDYRHEVERFFRPEFVNRIDQVIPFGHLTKPMIEAICRKELNDLEQREGLKEAGIRLQFSDDVINLLTETGFDADLGARPLKRTIETVVVTPLSRYLIHQRGAENLTLSISLDEEGQLQIVSDE